MAGTRPVSGAVMTGRPVFRRTLLCAAWLLGAGCTSPSSSSHQTPSSAPPAAPPSVSHDWHPLLLAPLGTWFRDMPVPLSEVLQFQEAGESARGEECFKPKDIEPPRFLNQAPQDYLLCFVGDRLSRVEAAVHVPADRGAALFGAACADWQRHAKPGPGVPAPITADSCEGRDGDIAFSGRLVNAATSQADPSAAVAPPAPAASTISLSLARVAP
jgi:hypothetical protein